jgi:hypothetical protein
MSIVENIKCPECHRKGHGELIIRKKQASFLCACGHFEKERVPYPKHRQDHNGYQYPFRIGDVRPLRSHDKDYKTCSQEEWDNRKE